MEDVEIVERKRKSFGFNVLGLLSGISMILAMLFPWWYFKMDINVAPTVLYPYIINGPAAEFIGYKRSPTMTILAIVLIVCIILLFLGSFLKKKIGRIFLFSSGAIILLAVWRLLVRVAEVAERFEVPMQGNKWASYGGFARVEVWTRLEPGVYFAVVAGLLAIIASIFHKKLWLRVE